MSWTVLDDSSPRARRQHRCDDCLRIIEPGESYRRVRAITDDGPQVYKSCQQCTAVLGAIWRCDPEAAYYDEGIDLHEYLREYSCGALLVQFERQWSAVPVDAVALSWLPNWKRPVAAQVTS